MIDYEKLKSWLLERCKDESELLQLLQNHPQARAMTFGAGEAYRNVIRYLDGELDD
jgi:hypothetical protein